jgi:hypothetical protein
MFNSKKGVENMLFIILDLILLLMVAGAFSFFLYNLRNNTEFERGYLTRDIALLAHAIYASPGEIKYDYYSNLIHNDVTDVDQQIILSDFNFEFDGSRIRIADKRSPTSYISYPYYPIGAVTPKLDSPKSLSFHYLLRQDIPSLDITTKS